MSSTILLVEDDQSIRECLSEVLRDRGYAVETASNGLEALELVARAPTRYGLMVLDIAMPVMDGPELLRRMAEAGLNVPTIIVSAARRMLDLGQFRWLPKPFELGDLEAAVVDCLGQP